MNVQWASEVEMLPGICVLKDRSRHRFVVVVANQKDLARIKRLRERMIAKDVRTLGEPIFKQIPSFRRQIEGSADLKILEVLARLDLGHREPKWYETVQEYLSDAWQLSENNRSLEPLPWDFERRVREPKWDLDSDD